MTLSNAKACKENEGRKSVTPCGWLMFLDVYWLPYGPAPRYPLYLPVIVEGGIIPIHGISEDNDVPQEGSGLAHELRNGDCGVAVH